MAIKGLHVKGLFNTAPPTATDPAKAHKLPVEFYVERPGRYWLANYGSNPESPPRRILSDGLRYMEIDPDTKTCTTGKEIPLAAELKVEEMLQVLFAEQFLGGLNAAYKKMGSQRVRGIRTDVYEHIRSLGPVGTARIVLYLDLAVGLPVQAIGHQQVKGQPERVWFTLTNIEPNASIPSALLNFDPPAGYNVIHEDRQPEEIGTGGGVSVDNTRGTVRFAINIDDRAILLCWGLYDTSKPASAQEDIEGPLGRPLKLVPLSQMPGRTYGHHFLRADPAGKFHWRWSLLVPTAGGRTLDGDEPRMEFTGKPGGTGVLVI